MSISFSENGKAFNIPECGYYRLTAKEFKGDLEIEDHCAFRIFKGDEKRAECCFDEQQKAEMEKDGIKCPLW